MKRSAMVPGFVAALVLLLTMFTLPAAAALGVSTPEQEGVPSEAVLKWIDACEAKLDALHGFVLVRQG